MDGFKSLVNKSLLVNDAKYWTLTGDNKATFANNEISVSPSTFVYLTSINLSKYQYFHIEFELFNPTNNRIQFGVTHSDNSLILTQDTTSTYIDLYKNGANNRAKTYSSNLFAQTNTWHNIQIEKKSTKISFKVDETIFTLSDTFKGDCFYFRKWHEGSLKVRNIEILTTYKPSCKIVRKSLSSMIYMISMILVK